MLTPDSRGELLRCGLAPTGRGLAAVPYWLLGALVPHGSGRRREVVSGEYRPVSRRTTVTVAAAVDWASLLAAARDAATRAYAPYSGFPVGAAGLVDDGRVVVGCNVENASFGLTLCAECSLVSQLHLTGGGRLVAVVCVTGGGADGGADDGAPVLPCGRCRQLLSEHGGPDLLVGTPAAPVRLAALLPDPFGPADLGCTSPTSGQAEHGGG